MRRIIPSLSFISFILAAVALQPTGIKITIQRHMKTLIDSNKIILSDPRATFAIDGTCGKWTWGALGQF